jgi:hypothetical protein
MEVGMHGGRYAWRLVCMEVIMYGGWYAWSLLGFDWLG